MVMPFLAIHLTVERGIPAVVSGGIWTVAGLCGAAMQWVAGALTDRVGRRPVMIASMIVRAANMVALGYFTSINAPVLAIGGLIVINSLTRAFFDPVASALVADLCGPEERVSAYSLQRVGINIGWAAGPFIASIAHGVPYSTLFYVGAPMTLVAMLGILHMSSPPVAACAPNSLTWSEMTAFRSDARFVRFMLATLAFFILQAQLYQALSIFAARDLHLNRAQVGTLYTLNGVLVVCLQLLAAGFIRRVGTRHALVIGSIGYAVAYSAVGQTSGHVGLLLCVAAITLAEIVTAPAQQTSVAALAPEGKMGAYQGLYGVCWVAGQSVGPIVGTALLDAVPARIAWFLLGLFGAAAALGYRLALPPVPATNKALASGGQA